MLPKKLRLPSTQSHLVYKFGKRSNLSFLQMQFWQNGNAGLQWMIQVPKKQVQKAINRNRIKRLISEAIIKLTPTLKKNGYAVVKFTKTDKLDYRSLKLQDVKEVLEQVVEKVGMLT